jgi:hypothetical protein
MNSIIPKNDLIDDVHLRKHEAANKMRKVLDMVGDEAQKGMVKTASSGQNGQLDTSSLIVLFTQMLSTLNMTANGDDIKDVVNRIAKGSVSKEASINKDSKERKDDIKIVSKSIKDSHFQVDISKDIIKQNGQEVFMVSCYARDAYLGRYLIKRNYFYTTDREKEANSSYDEIMTKVASIKDRYYNELIETSAIFTQIKQVLDGVISEIEIKENSIATNIKR